MEDAQIIALFWSRSETAIGQLAAKYGKLIFQIAHNILANREDAEECANDTYLGAWNAIPPRRPDPLAAFVCRITRNTALNRRRANRAQKRGPLPDLPLAELEDCLPGPSMEEVCSARELGRAIDAFLDTLDPENRAIFLRRYWFSDPVGTIAAELGLRENTVSVRLSRLRGRLKTYLEKEGVTV